ncbi:hypothetical protein ACHAWF_003165 [Thalassiosira exigua]
MDSSLDRAGTPTPTDVDQRRKGSSGGMWSLLLPPLAIAAALAPSGTREGGEGAAVAAFAPPAVRVRGRSRTAPPPPVRIAVPRELRAASSGVDPAAALANAKRKRVEEDYSHKGRPFHEQWWPVAAVSSLRKDRPNELRVLGRSLVAFWDGGGWRAFDDRCSHRFAPLSEGRVVEGGGGEGASSSCRLQCAYHGWEFDSSGTCVRVPQEPDRIDAARPVRSYPVREELSLLWTWTDPDSYESLGASIPLPIDPLVREAVEEMGPSMCFQRDLPYGMEILGENLLDLSHLPFAHHSVGTLRRDLGGPLPTRMLSRDEREERSLWECEEAGEGHAPVLPVFQAEIVDAARHDPVHMMAAKGLPSNVTDSWSTTIGYYEPCHVRYRRDKGPGGGGSHVELFFCPIEEGKSRVFLFNIFKRGSPSSPPPAADAPLLTRAVHWCKPSTWKEKATRALIKKFLTGERGHLLSHSIFDGDGVFLQMQGRRMKSAGLSYRDYSTPSSADVLLNAYRRFLDRAARRTREELGRDGKAVADAVTGDGAYGDDGIDRSVLLDRYNTHTKHCPICLSALRKARRRRARAEAIGAASRGAAGASAAATGVLLATVRGGTSATWAGPVLRASATALAGAVAAAWAGERSRRKRGAEVDAFLFEDYVHAEKN